MKDYKTACNFLLEKELKFNGLHYDAFYRGEYTISLRYLGAAWACAAKAEDLGSMANYDSKFNYLLGKTPPSWRNSNRGKICEKLDHFHNVGQKILESTLARELGEGLEEEYAELDKLLTSKKPKEAAWIKEEFPFLFPNSTED